MMRSLPETRYAKSGDVHIAYQVIGEGPLDLVVVPGWVSHLEYQWEEPWGARFFHRLASFCRFKRAHIAPRSLTSALIARRARAFVAFAPFLPLSLSLSPGRIAPPCRSHPEVT
jgi:hypothetical protein